MVMNRYEAKESPPPELLEDYQEASLAMKTAALDDETPEGGTLRKETLLKETLRGETGAALGSASAAGDSQTPAVAPAAANQGKEASKSLTEDKEMPAGASAGASANSAAAGKAAGMAADEATGAAADEAAGAAGAMADFLPREDRLRFQLRDRQISLAPQRDVYLTAFGKATLADRYKASADESNQNLFARVACHFSDDDAHAQRLYDYMSRLWFMPATPVLSNGGTKRGLPVSCYINEASDSLTGIVDLWTENVWLAARGGGIGSYWGNLRPIGEGVGRIGRTSGIVPFIRVMDSLTLAISQGSLRRGSAAVYLPVTHPEIEEFIEIRRPTGGDPNRKALNLHHGVVIPDAFMRAVIRDESWPLRSEHSQQTLKTIGARALWIRILLARLETGEPYLFFSDHVARAQPEHHKLAGLRVKTSNLCSEITLPTGTDHLGNARTAICCLSSLNLATYDEWEDNEQIVADVLRFLDNVLEDFIRSAPDTMERARYAAMRERSVGLGVMGFHSFLQSKGVPLESVLARSWNKRIFSRLRAQADTASRHLAAERGACPDAAERDISERFSHKIAIAPTASISIICGGTSPGIEPILANAYTHKTLSGSFPVRNATLGKCLAAHGRDNEETWRQIVVNEGSVQHLDFLSDRERLIFRTAFEIDQRWLIDLAAQRQPYVCQAQSLNLFLSANVHKRDLHTLHMRAWQKGVKSLYYCRSKSLQRAEVAPSHLAAAMPEVMPRALRPIAAPTSDDECLACQ